MASNFVQTGKKLVCIGRNYAMHAKELGNQVPKEPFFFLKPTTSYLANGGTVELPQGENVHYEVELGVVVGQKTRDVTARQAMDHVAGYTLAIDMTGRKLQEAAKKAGLPWSASKGFDTFTPIGDFIPKSDIKDPYNLELFLQINGKDRQRETTGNMIFRIAELLQHCSSIMTLEEGDLLLTGTPSGVGPIVDGDKMTAGMLDLLNKRERLALWEGRAKDRVGGYKA